VRRALLLLSLVGCGGLPAEDAKDVENAARSSAMAYRYVTDADSNQAMLLCATQASLQAVIRDQKLAPYDAGIPCQ
jgi:hypothetical protein